MTYLFSGNSTITNEVEVKNDVGNALPVVGNVWLNNNTSRVTILNPLPVTLGGANITVIGILILLTLLQLRVHLKILFTFI